MTSSFLYGTFRANERVCSDTDRFCSDSDRFCSFDNWLCDPISENWQLTLRKLLKDVTQPSEKKHSGIEIGIKQSCSCADGVTSFTTKSACRGFTTCIVSSWLSFFLHFFCVHLIEIFSSPFFEKRKYTNFGGKTNI